MLFLWSIMAVQWWCCAVRLWQNVGTTCRRAPETSLLLVSPMDTQRTLTVCGGFLLLLERRWEIKEANWELRTHFCTYDNIISANRTLVQHVSLIGTNRSCVVMCWCSSSCYIGTTVICHFVPLCYFVRHRLFWILLPWISSGATCVGTTTWRSETGSGEKLLWKVFNCDLY